MRRVVAAGATVAALVALASAALATNDPFWNQQYAPKQISAPEAWARSRGAGVKIAIIDSGLDLDHPDLRPRLVASCPGSGCRDIADDDDNPDDDSTATYQNSSGNQVPVKGHGTMVGGVAAAATDNGIGVAGIAPDAQLMPLKVFGEGGTSVARLVSNVPEAVEFALDHGAKVLNLSIGDIGLAAVVGTIESSCNNAFSRGALCVVSTGNEGTEPSGYSEGFNAVLVTANDEQGRHAASAQKADSKWGLSAPGVGVVSTHPTDVHTYAKATGTSIAAPHVSGVAALLFAQGLSNQAVVDRMRATATPMGDPDTNGSGRVNAAAAVGASATPPPPSGGGGGKTSTGAAGTGGTPGVSSNGTAPGESTTVPPTTETTTSAADAEPGEPVPLDVGLGADDEEPGDDTDGLAAAVAAVLLLGVAGATASRLKAPWAARARAR